MKTLITLLAIFSSSVSFGQKNIEFPSFEKFYSNFGENLRYPSGLQDEWPSTITLMKINFTGNGDVQSISLSDSAFPQFVHLMEKMKEKLDFNSIYQDIKAKQKDVKQVLIPIHIDYEKIDVWKSSISSEDFKKLYVFNGKPISGKYFLYPNIYYKYVAGRVNE